MSIFDEILHESESVFLNELALDYEFIPKIIPYRENQQKHIATCMAPLFQEHNGRNIIVFGPPGVGKTVATKHILNDIEERTDDIVPIYINCWQNNTSYKITLALCEAIGYKFTHNKNTGELFDIVSKVLNKKSTVFVFDEIDKAEDTDFLYLILQKIHTKSVVLLTNFKDWIADIDMRIRSRLIPELLEFKPYNKEEVRGIIKQRVGLAFVEGVWEADALNMIVDQTFEAKDLRIGLYYLAEAGRKAEEESARKITVEHVEQAVEKQNEFKIKNIDDLSKDAQEILGVIKHQKEPMKIGELFKKFQTATDSDISYKTFTRKIHKLQEGKYIKVKKLEGGAMGNTKLISYNSQDKTLDDFS